MKNLLPSAMHLEERENIEFQQFSGATKEPKNQQFAGFWGAHGSGYMCLAATMWVPMCAQVPVLSPNDHPHPPWGRQKGFGQSQSLKNFQVPLHSLTNLKTARARGRLGVPGGSELGPLPRVRGSIYKKEFYRT